MSDGDSHVDVGIVRYLRCSCNPIYHLHQLHVEYGGAPYKEEPGCQVANTLDQDDWFVPQDICQEEGAENGHAVGVGPDRVHQLVDVVGAEVLSPVGEIGVGEVRG